MKFNKKDPQHRFAVNRGRAFIDQNGDLVSIPSPQSLARTPLSRQLIPLTEINEARAEFLRNPDTPESVRRRFP